MKTTKLCGTRIDHDDFHRTLQDVQIEQELTATPPPRTESGRMNEPFPAVGLGRWATEHPTLPLETLIRLSKPMLAPTGIDRFAGAMPALPPIPAQRAKSNSGH